MTDLEIKQTCMTEFDAMANEFYQFPQCMIKDPNVVSILKHCPQAITVYALCRNMWNLSRQNQDRFTDSLGRIFCILPQQQIADTLQCSIETVKRCFAALKKAGAIYLEKNSFSASYKMYLPPATTIMKTCYDLAHPESVKDDTSESVKDDTTKVSEMTLLNNNKDISNKNEKDIGTHYVRTNVPPDGAPVVLSAKGKKLLDVKPKTKAQKNAQKWLRERMTQLNGRGYTQDVEMAIQTFLASLAESGKSANFLSSISWALQLDKLDELKTRPDLQYAAAYDAAAHNSKSMIWAVEKQQKAAGLYVDEKSAFSRERRYLDATVTGQRAQEQDNEDDEEVYTF